ncbi:MAG: hypothetical protein WC099_00645 [Candidatus Paceibacterota bacterium]
MKKLEFKKDNYRRVRGGSSKFLNISCSQCGTFVALYQKDGIGSLKRMYLDRISAPEELTQLRNYPLEKISPLTCTKCKEIMGIPFLYEKEKRPSFRMIHGSFSKKVEKIKI